MKSGAGAHKLFGELGPRSPAHAAGAELISAPLPHGLLSAGCEQRAGKTHPGIVMEHSGVMVPQPRGNVGTAAMGSSFPLEFGVSPLKNHVLLQLWLLGLCVWPSLVPNAPRASPQALIEPSHFGSLITIKSLWGPRFN